MVGHSGARAAVGEGARLAPPLTLNGLAVAAHQDGGLRCEPEDIGRDGLLDLVCQFGHDLQLWRRSCSCLGHMGVEFRPGGPGDLWRELLRRGTEMVRAAADAVVREAHAVAAAAADAMEAGAVALRRGWAAAWPRVVAANDAIERRVRAAAARLGPALGRLHPATIRLRSFLGRAAAAIRRHKPTPRQALLLLVPFLLAAWVLWERCGVGGCPDVDRLTSYQPGGAPVLLDRYGEPFGDLRPVEHRVVPLDSLPPHVAHAMIAVEDKRFFQHHGLDWRRVIGALIADIRAGAPVQGSSTLSMQLARTLFPDRIRRQEKTLGRKLLEARVAREIEDRFTKDEILELYLNHVYFGGGAYGVQAASRLYFGKDAHELAVEEAALLAALPRAPAHYDPRGDPDAARARRDLVLTLMERQGYLPFREAEAARRRELAVLREADRDPDGDVVAPYFVKHVRQLLEAELGQDLYASRLRIVTTLDPRAQEAAEEELATQLRAVERGAYGRFRGSRPGEGTDPDADGPRYLQGAVVLMDARRGDILAWVGGRHYDDSRFDRALLARRQAGSAFKPFVYAAALEAGLSPSQPILDAPYRLAVSRNQTWEPRNYSGGFEGRMSLRDALVRSQNVPAARLAAAVGEERVAAVARRVGIDGDIPATPVAALGVTAVSPLEMTTAYSAFATLGIRARPRFLLRVEDEEGALLWESEPAGARVMAPSVAYILTDMLRDVVDRGTGTAVRHAGYRGAAAGKTGTTSDATDVWFVGYTPRLVGTVWVGFDDMRPLPYRATGGGVAAPVWGRIMARLDRDPGHPHGEEGGWARPDGVVTARVDPETGLALEEGCLPWWDSPRRELFLEGQEPATTCPRRGRGSWYDRLSGWFGSRYDRYHRPRLEGPPDPDLGFPRLPRRGEETNGHQDEAGDGRSDGVLGRPYYETGRRDRPSRRW